MGDSVIRLRASAGTVDLPVADLHGMQSRSLYGGDEPIGADGSFVIEMPETGVRLVALDGPDGAPIARVLFPAHPDLVEDAIHTDTLHIAASAVVASTSLHSREPRWTAMVEAVVANLPETQDAAELLDAQLAKDPQFLSGAEWYIAVATAAAAFGALITDVAVDSGSGCRFGGAPGILATAQPDSNNPG